MTMTKLLKHYVKDNLTLYGIYGLFAILAVIAAAIFRQTSGGFSTTLMTVSSLGFAGLIIGTIIAFFDDFFHDFDKGEGARMLLAPIPIKTYLLSRYVGMWITFGVFGLLVLAPFILILSPAFAQVEAQMYTTFNFWSLITLREVALLVVRGTLAMAVYGLVYVLVSLLPVPTFIGIVLGIAGTMAFWQAVSLITVGVLMVFGYELSNSMFWTQQIVIASGDWLGHVVYLAVRVISIVGMFMGTAYILEKKLSI